MAKPKADSVFDVAKPGKKAPDATSRPLIVSHGSGMAHDPMVSQETEAAPATKIRRNKVIAPLNNAPAADADEAEPAANEETAESKQSTEEEAPKISDSAAVDAVADQAASKKKQPEVDKAAEEANKVIRQHLDQLAADKTYFLPIGQVTRKRNDRNNLIILVVLVVLVAAGGYAAYTLGLLKSLNIGR